MPIRYIQPDRATSKKESRHTYAHGKISHSGSFDELQHTRFKSYRRSCLFRTSYFVVSSQICDRICSKYTNTVVDTNENRMSHRPIAQYLVDGSSVFNQFTASSGCVGPVGAWSLELAFNAT